MNHFLVSHFHYLIFKFYHTAFLKIRTDKQVVSLLSYVRRAVIFTYGVRGCLYTSRGHPCPLSHSLLQSNTVPFIRVTSRPTPSLRGPIFGPNSYRKLSQAFGHRLVFFIYISLSYFSKQTKSPILASVLRGDGKK